MENTPKVSILVAVYNAQPYLKKCIESLIGQTYHNLQIICVDDASSDGSLDELRAFAALDDRLKVLHNEQNQGLSKARNRALELADGKFITMVDADDWLAHDAVEKAMQVLCAHPDTDCVLFNLVKYYKENNEYRPYPTDTATEPLSGEEAFIKSLGWNIHALCVIPTSLLKKMPFDEHSRIGADENTSRLHYLQCHNIRFSDGKYFYRQHSLSIIHRSQMVRLGYLTANAHFSDELERMGASLRARMAFEHLRWNEMVGQWNGYITRRNEFDSRQWAEILSAFHTAHATLHRQLLPMSVKMKCLWLPLMSFSCFVAWVKAYTAVRSIVNTRFLKKREHY